MLTFSWQKSLKSFLIASIYKRKHTKGRFEIEASDMERWGKIKDDIVITGISGISLAKRGRAKRGKCRML